MLNTVVYKQKVDTENKGGVGCVTAIGRGQPREIFRSRIVGRWLKQTTKSLSLRNTKKGSYEPEICYIGYTYLNTPIYVARLASIA
jgi:hypothetical protein